LVVLVVKTTAPAARTLGVLAVIFDSAGGPNRKILPAIPAKPAISERNFRQNGAILPA
jgi:hypothetical protein